MSKDKISTLTKVEDETGNRAIVIKGAALKDSYCNYSYELTDGPTEGDTVGRKGSNIVHDDLSEAFKNLDVFMAHIEGAFAGEFDNQTPLKDLQASEKLQSYTVDGFEITGVEENEGVTFSGSKRVFHGAIKFKTPKIKFSGMYLYMDELQEAISNAVSEVEQYMNGKKAPQYEQVAMDFGDVNKVDDLDFETAKVG